MSFANIKGPNRNVVRKVIADTDFDMLCTMATEIAEAFEVFQKGADGEGSPLDLLNLSRRQWGLERALRLAVRTGLGVLNDDDL